MPYNLVADSIHTKKLYSRLFDEERPFCVFDPPLGSLQATYARSGRPVRDR